MPPTRRLFALLALLAAAPVSADTLDMPERAGAEADSMALELPGRGMAMKAVRARFGEPEEVRPAVGDPPITRWVYDGYTVYFEHRYVIHSVPHRDD
ncbi:MAG TPA: phosphodiesterase [Gammaproteobacteria bacterium]|nr:phosphodiesterase [Gammaproteobacteria bacterium]